MVSFCNLCSLLLAFSFAFLSRFENFVDARTQDHYNSTASLSTRWTNNATAYPDARFGNSVTIRAILVRGKEASGPAYACGFYCQFDCSTFLFAIFRVPIQGGALFVQSETEFPEVVWSANRNNGVKIGATLELTSEGDLVLKDADGTVAWSTNTSGKSVVGLNMTDSGNLVLFDKNNATVWQSFDQLTDTLVPGQKLMAGQKLMTADGMITLSVNDYGFSAQMQTSPPQIYYQTLVKYPTNKIKSPYLELVNGSLALFSDSTTILASLPVPRASSLQHIQLGLDGHLGLYEYGTPLGLVTDLLTEYIGICGYPTACGQYGICSGGACSCPASNGGASYFKPVDDKQPNLGCSENVSLSCGASQYQSFLELQNVTYFTFTADLENVDASSLWIGSHSRQLLLTDSVVYTCQ
ncbi:EP1-like glycoprotein 2 [Rhodamnia argentea]|uniref:EP1-like glycoprotein 2 n=1 Tax=Rhodamnia argentea TaxID=178133 RepID=A0ABM3HMZ8_9MYRT|nr:EP1-like glycoprotein 2 [Rhodamnia argentea]